MSQTLFVYEILGGPMDGARYGVPRDSVDKFPQYISYNQYVRPSKPPSGTGKVQLTEIHCKFYKWCRHPGAPPNVDSQIAYYTFPDYKYPPRP